MGRFGGALLASLFILGVKAGSKFHGICSRKLGFRKLVGVRKRKLFDFDRHTRQGQTEHVLESVVAGIYTEH